MRIDYLRDGPPEFLDVTAHVMRRPDVTPLAHFLVVGVAIVAIGWSAERWQVARESAAVHRLEDRVAATTVAAARVESEAGEVRRLRDLERELHGLRVSGAGAVAAIGRLANAMPDDTWLTSMSVQGRELVVSARASTLDAVGDTLRRVRLSQLAGVHAPTDPRQRILDFQFTAQASPQ